MYSKREKVVNKVDLMIKQARKHNMQGGYSKYGLSAIFPTEI
jgi:hypothetical protein